MQARTLLGIAVVGIAALAGGVSSLAAQDSPSEPPPFGPARKTPLFDPQNMPTDRREALLEAARAALSNGRPSVVCGVTVIPALPAVDPKSIRKAPDDRKYTMRSVPPGLCGTSEPQLKAPDSSIPVPNPDAAR